MKRKVFYISLVIIALIGIGADIGLGARKKALREQYCPNNNCTKVVKEYQELSLLSSPSLVSENKSLDSSLDASLDESLISPEATDANIHVFPEGIGDRDASNSNNDYYKHNLFMAGLNIESNQEGVEGINFIAGNEIKVNGNQQTLATAGARIYVNGVTENDVYVAGGEITFDKDSIQRDIYAAGGQIKIRGTVLGNIYVAGGIVTFENATVAQGVNVAAGSIIFKGDNTFYGNFNYNEDARTENMNKDKMAGISTYVDIDNKKDAIKTVLKTLSVACVSAVAIAIFSILIAALGRKHYAEITETKQSPKNFLKGALTIIIIPIVAWLLSILSYFSIIGGFVCMAVAFAGFIAFAFTTVRIGAFVSKTVLKATDKSAYRDVLVGAITTSIIMVIPVVGALFIAILVICNVGLLTSMLKSRNMINLSSLEASTDSAKPAKKSKK